MGGGMGGGAGGGAGGGMGGTDGGGAGVSVDAGAAVKAETASAYNKVGETAGMEGNEGKAHAIMARLGYSREEIALVCE